jgi:hypothetical protein
MLLLELTFRIVAPEFVAVHNLLEARGRNDTKLSLLLLSPSAVLKTLQALFLYEANPASVANHTVPSLLIVIELTILSGKPLFAAVNDFSV